MTECCCFRLPPTNEKQLLPDHIKVRLIDQFKEADLARKVQSSEQCDAISTTRIDTTAIRHSIQNCLENIPECLDEETQGAILRQLVALQDAIKSPTTHLSLPARRPPGGSSAGALFRQAHRKRKNGKK